MKARAAFRAMRHLILVISFPATCFGSGLGVPQQNMQLDSSYSVGGQLLVAGLYSVTLVPQPAGLLQRAPGSDAILVFRMFPIDGWPSDPSSIDALRRQADAEAITRCERRRSNRLGLEVSVQLIDAQNFAVLTFRYFEHLSDGPVEVFCTLPVQEARDP